MKGSMLQPYLDDPERALAALAIDRPDLGLTRRVSADQLDAILGAIKSPSAARACFERALVPSRRVELVAAHGDLPSVAASVAAPPDLFAAIIADLLSDVPDADKAVALAPRTFDRREAFLGPVRPQAGPEDMAADEDDGHEDDVGVYEQHGESLDDDGSSLDSPPRSDVGPVFVLPWALKILDRPDAAELYAAEFCRRSFGDWVLLALFDENAGSPPRSVLDEYGFDDPREALRRLAVLVDDEGDRSLTVSALIDEEKRFLSEMSAPVQSAPQARIDDAEERVGF